MLFHEAFDQAGGLEKVVDIDGIARSLQPSQDPMLEMVNRI
jgi:hypothetical protein